MAAMLSAHSQLMHASVPCFTLWTPSAPRSAGTMSWCAGREWGGGWLRMTLLLCEERYVSAQPCRWLLTNKPVGLCLTTHASGFFSAPWPLCVSQLLHIIVPFSSPCFSPLSLSPSSNQKWETTLSDPNGRLKVTSGQCVRGWLSKEW